MLLTVPPSQGLPIQKTHERRLSAPAAADNPDLLTRSHLEAQVLDDGFVWRVSEGNVFEPDRSGFLVQNDLRSFLYALCARRRK